MNAVVFDMDGVVVDSETHWRALERELFREVCATGDPDPGEVTGMNYREVYDYLADEYGVTVPRRDLEAKYEDAAMTVYGDRADLLPGFRDVVADVRDAGAAVGLASSSPHDWIDVVVDRFDLHDAFDVRVSADDVSGGKPAPDVFEYAADRLEVPPEECVAVEDSAHGVAAATAAGMACVGYRTTHNEDVLFEHANAVAESPAELHEVVVDAVAESD